MQPSFGHSKHNTNSGEEVSPKVKMVFTSKLVILHSMLSFLLYITKHNCEFVFSVKEKVHYHNVFYKTFREEGVRLVSLKLRVVK